MPQVPELLELLKAGVHFGHQQSRWHPKMAPFLFGVRNGVHVIDLEETQKKLALALAFLKQSAAEGKIILFVGTKDQAKEIVQKFAVACEMPYVSERWLGGLLTNYTTINALLKKFRKLKADQASGELAAKYTKSEVTKFGKYIQKMEKTLSGLVYLERKPDVLFLIDIKKEKTALREAIATGVKTVAFCDSNVNPEAIDYIIPANDDASKSIELITRLAAEAVKEGKAQAHQLTNAAA
ncbi:MAG: 30S ribosomal protein S2 [Candidatus Magasanikbacteria bacterium GW2011_GWA2_45_39]|uniref:Small ribosomal subunit protein uS2 n=2 Tax=Candidatus Magasanikiibacteriota TaxID=1752731 RepID=A0A0G1MY62_9BACT|nr:MAG: 30S ribosomal protein S2 [Candidatus Magasanikbacteria bacterium GW2011_GWA2_45_39]KKU13316.1 MAG: 30S ribosomal protein S2 [Candidatus Magasanikbacteria bacterium GW2011_GWC2_45_8]HBW74379.1 30S ribosomal protein S2 [Candidatus Magasanikbacteria bacterium]